MTDLEYLKLSKLGKLRHDFLKFIASLPGKFLHGVINFLMMFVRIGQWFAGEIKDIVLTFIKGDWKTRISFVVMGFGSIARGQIFRGILFLLFQTIFNLYMVNFGISYLAKFGTLGTVETTMDLRTRVTVYGDNSFLILLYGILTIFFIFAFIYTWRVNLKQNKLAQEFVAAGRKLKTAKDDIGAMLDSQFHKTLLALPVLGIFVFTVLPIVFMILVAFTNYDATHQSPAKLFTWVGFDNFKNLFSAGGASFGSAFGQVLLWTLIWAFFATFINYFLGMVVAMLINKKGIRLKKMWRTILVMTIAIPQFVSLLYVSKIFAADGLINSMLMNWGWISAPLPFWTNPTWAKVTVILINVWIGIPYVMLIATGILMNIPADLYESARIDGANAFQTYYKITLPYMLFVTGPYLLTSFIGNINNFNVIYLLTQGKPDILGNSAGATDLLITWLYSLTVDNTDYKMAACIGIIVFVVCAVINLIVYNLIPSVKNEEDFQ